MFRAVTIADYGRLRKLTPSAIFLNNQFLLTRGAGASARGALFSPLSAFTGLHTFASQSAGRNQAVFAQAYQPAGAPLAHCVFVAPATALDSPAMAELLDGITKQLGEHGALSILAEVEEVHPLFKTLRQNGFSIVARQRMWKIKKAPATRGQTNWQPALDRDQLGVHLLRKALVPGQVQQIEMESSQPLDGYVLRKEGEIVAFAEVKRGPRGVWVLPFVHLDAEPFDAALSDLVARLHPRNSQPVYICLRSYQDWLESALEDLGAEAGPRQVVMARRTSLPLLAEESRRVAVPSRGAEPTTPLHVPEPQAQFAEPARELEAL